MSLPLKPRAKTGTAAVVISAIKATKQPGWFWLKFEDDDRRIKVNQDILLEFALATGVELDEHKFIAVEESSNYHKTKSKFLNWVSMRTRSKKEIRDYLKRNDVDADRADEFIELAGRVGNNDNDFALSRARHRRQQFKSDRMIRFELQSQGLTTEQIDQAIEDLEHDEVWAIKQLLSGRLAAKTSEKAREYLMRQGFNLDQVKKLVSSSS